MWGVLKFVASNFKVIVKVVQVLVAAKKAGHEAGLWTEGQAVGATPAKVSEQVLVEKQL